MNNENGTLFAPSSCQTKEREKRRSPWWEVWRRLRRNKAAVVGMSVVILLVVVAVLSPVLAPYDPNQTNIKMRLQGPSSEHPLGTDNFGRDMLSRIIYGSRISLYVGFVAVGIGAVFGGILGAIGGYYGGRLDNFIMRCMDVLLAIPQIILAIAIVGALGTSLLNLMIAVGISQLPRYARVVRASALTVRGQEYVEAARAWERATPGSSWRTSSPTAWHPSSSRAPWEWPRPSFRRRPSLSWASASSPPRRSGAPCSARGGSSCGTHRTSPFFLGWPSPWWCSP